MKELNELLDDLEIIAERIANGTKGSDYSVLEDNDKKKGYSQTPLEIEFSGIIEKTAKQLDEKNFTPEDLPEVIIRAVRILLLVRPAVEAYRSKMDEYEGRTGSALSPIAETSRVLYYSIQEMIDRVDSDERQSMAQELDKEILNEEITVYYWETNDTHRSETMTFAKLLGEKSEKK